MRNFQAFQHFTMANFNCIAIILATCFVFTNCVVQIRNAEALDDRFEEFCPQLTWDNLPTQWAYQSSFERLITVDVAVKLHRFIEIDDLAQSMSLYLDVDAQWTLPCNASDFCKNISRSISDEEVPGEDGDDSPAASASESSNCPGDEELQDLSFYRDKGMTWYPILIHQNSIKKPWHVVKEIGDSVTVYPFQSKLEWGFKGRLNSACSDFSFRKFPFDQLNCSIILESEEASKVVHYKIREFMVHPASADDFIGDTEIWDHEHYSMTSAVIITNPYDGGRQHHRLSFSLFFKRKYQYFLCNVLIPTYALNFLQLAAMIMPPRLPDRPSFSVTVVLASSVILGLVFQDIPKTSEPVYLVHIIISKLLCGVVITVHSLLACSIAKDPRFTRTIKAFCGLSLIRAIDCVVAVIVIATTVLLDAVYFGLMTS